MSSRVYNNVNAMANINAAVTLVMRKLSGNDLAIVENGNQPEELSDYIAARINSRLSAFTGEKND